MNEERGKPDEGGGGQREIFLPRCESMGLENRPICKGLKPIFHQSLCWVANANKIDSNNIKCTWPMGAPKRGDPTRPIFHLVVLGQGCFTLGSRGLCWVREGL